MLIKKIKTFIVITLSLASFSLLGFFTPFQLTSLGHDILKTMSLYLIGAIIGLFFGLYIVFYGIKGKSGLKKKQIFVRGGVIFFVSLVFLEVIGGCELKVVLLMPSIITGVFVGSVIR